MSEHTAGQAADMTGKEIKTTLDQLDKEWIDAIRHKDKAAVQAIADRATALFNKLVGKDEPEKAAADG